MMQILKQSDFNSLQIFIYSLLKVITRKVCIIDQTCEFTQFPLCTLSIRNKFNFIFADTRPILVTVQFCTFCAVLMENCAVLKFEIFCFQWKKLIECVHSLNYDYTARSQHYMLYVESCIRRMYQEENCGICRDVEHPRKMSEGTSYLN